VKLAAFLLVAIGVVGLVAAFVLMRRNLDRLRQLRQEVDR
jgi:HAMP domain-containing protein